MSFESAIFNTYGLENTAGNIGQNLARLLGDGYECERHSAQGNKWETLADIKSPNSTIRFEVQSYAGDLQIKPSTGGRTLRDGNGSVMTNGYIRNLGSFPDRKIEIRMYKSPKGTFAFSVQSLSDDQTLVTEEESPVKDICYTKDVEGNGVMLMTSGISTTGYVIFARNGMADDSYIKEFENTNLTTSDTRSANATVLVRAMDLWHGDYLSDVYVLRYGNTLDHTIVIGGKAYIKIIYWGGGSGSTGLAFQYD